MAVSRFASIVAVVAFRFSRWISLVTICLANGCSPDVTLVDREIVGGRTSLTSTISHRAYRSCGQAHLRMIKSTHPISIIRTPTCQSMAIAPLNHKPAM